MPILQRAALTYTTGDEFAQSISYTGEYVGTFTRADAHVARTGAQGIAFSFKSSEGALAKYLNLYTHNKDGNSTYGAELLSGLLVCLGLSTIVPEREVHSRWSDEKNKYAKQEIDVYPALLNATIGILLRREEYFKNDGDIGTSLAIVEFFEPKTRRSAREVVDDLPATRIDSVLANISDRLLTSTEPSVVKLTETDVENNPSAANSADFDDPIPF